MGKADTDSATKIKRDKGGKVTWDLSKIQPLSYIEYNAGHVFIFTYFATTTAAALQQ